MNYEAHIEAWMYDAETADWLATDTDWLNIQYDDAKDLARAAGKTPTGVVSLKEYNQTGTANDGGLTYDFVFNVAVA